ncbi:hypothetical protein TcasGA2_TC033623 [Tribolium castaneum]|uniref:Uncharacterized protein n=1 Tax=Tribolium castaneum TaxID=7070 RepID=A0A139WFT5_TRICA|nr:hypothetical protein TcasGA2_TC033623 [Tribolium castaneum]
MLLVKANIAIKFEAKVSFCQNFERISSMWCSLIGQLRHRSNH